ncbi:MAG TPA: protein kinase [Pirellulales bacterium]|nr:protein kinase [Pirellulales bacterium]
MSDPSHEDDSRDDPVNDVIADCGEFQKNAVGVAPSPSDSPPRTPAPPVSETSNVTLPPMARNAVATATRYADLTFHKRGGLGALFRARDKDLHRDVVIKFIHERCRVEPEILSQFHVEAEVTGRLDHPGVVPVYGIGQDWDGQPFYVMRMIHGRELQTAIQEYHEAGGPANRSRENRQRLFALLEHLVSACNTVAYAHDVGIVHCDLKPVNIMIGKYGETFVLDWGLATSFERTATFVEANEPSMRPRSAESSQGGKRGGTLGYISPEQLSADGRVAPTSDVYSLGASLYEVLLGSPPFNGRDTDVEEQVRHGQFRRPRDVNRRVSRRLEAICLKAMSLAQKDRYRTAKQLAADLKNWMRDDEVHAAPDNALGRVSRHARRHRGITIAVFLAVLFATVVGTWAHLSRTHALQSEEQSRLVVETSLDTFEEICRPLAYGEMSNLRLFQPFIKQIQDFTAKYLASFESDHSMRPYTGRVFVLRATVARERFGDDSAENDYQSAARIFEGLVAEKPDDAESRLWLAKIQLSQARARLQRGDYLAAREPLDGAKRALDELSGSRQGDTTLLRYLAEADHSLGEFYLQLHAHGNDHQVLLQADEFFQESKDLRAQLVERTRKAEKLSHQRDLARSVGYLGDLYLRQGRVELARHDYEESLALRRDIFQRDPNPEQRFQYARGLANFGELERDYGGDFDGALTKLRTALAVQEKLADEFDEVERFQTDLGATLNLMAELHLFAAIDEADKADQHYEATRGFAERAAKLYGRFCDGAGAQPKQASRQSVLGLVTSKVMLALAERSVNPTESVNRAVEAETLVGRLLGAEETLNLHELLALAMARSLEGDPLKLPAAWSALDEAIERGQHAVDRIERHRALGFKTLADSPDWAGKFVALVKQLRHAVVSE